MSSDRKSNKSSIVSPYDNSEVEPRLPEETVEHHDLHHSSPTAERAYDKFIARGSADGHDLEDWISSEREIEDEKRASEASRLSDGSRKPLHKDARTS